jgi:hypothetical protein
MERSLSPAPWLEVVKTVLAGMLGVRRRADHEAGSVRLKPWHVIVAGIIAAALFVLTLITVVRVVLG